MDCETVSYTSTVLFVITLRGLNLLVLRGAVLSYTFTKTSPHCCACARSMLAYWPAQFCSVHTISARLALE